MERARPGRRFPSRINDFTFVPGLRFAEAAHLSRVTQTGKGEAILVRREGQCGLVLKYCTLGRGIGTKVLTGVEWAKNRLSTSSSRMRAGDKPERGRHRPDKVMVAFADDSGDGKSMWEAKSRNLRLRLQRLFESW